MTTTWGKTQSTVTIKMCLAKQPVRSQNTSQINVSSWQRDSIAMSGKANEHQYLYLLKPHINNNLSLLLMVDIFFSFLVACGNFTRLWRQINKVAPINHQHVGNYFEHLPLVSTISQQNYSLKQQYAALASSLLSLSLSLFLP